MAAQQGREFLLKVSDGAGGYDAVGGFKTNSFDINGQTVDITSKNSGGFKEALSGGGIVSINTRASGVFMDDTAFQTLHDAAFNNTHLDCQIVVPGFQTYTGTFTVPTLSMEGNTEDAITYSIEMESSGVIVVTATV